VQRILQLEKIGGLPNWEVGYSGILEEASKVISKMAADNHRGGAKRLSMNISTTPIDGATKLTLVDDDGRFVTYRYKNLTGCICRSGAISHGVIRSGLSAPKNLYISFNKLDRRKK
jgi:hypothetical protein